MLNLSDKELDRLSREAANQHDPGDPSGPRSWDKLEIRLDKELGRISPNPFRAIRRMPFWYAPVILLLLGVSYYVIKPGKGNNRPPSSNIPVVAGTEPTVSPPGTPQKAIPSGQAIKDSISITQNHTYNPTSTPEQNNEAVSPNRPSPDGSSPNGPSSVGPSTGGPEEKRTGNTISDTRKLSAGTVRSSSAKTYVSGNASGNTLSSGNKSASGYTTNTFHRRHPASYSNLSSGNLESGNFPSGNPSSGDQRSMAQVPDQSRQSLPLNQQPTVGYTAKTAREPVLSPVMAPGSMTRKPKVNDSALRAFTLINDPIKKKAPSMHVNRRLQFGLLVAPDFSSVHSLAGDRPGSSIGLTVDYQLFDRWHIGTGLLFSRKNYTARSEDYHAPMSFYWMYNLRNVALVKGTFNMLEIPLNIRYDLTVYNNTIFFMSGGLSSWINTNEKASYYFGFLGSDSKQFKYEPGNSYLFSTINLSLGVETGISNSLSLLIAPYVKIPTEGVGFGQVRMTSAGLNFALKLAPVLSRKRH